MKKKKTADTIVNLIIALLLLVVLGVGVALTNYGRQPPATFGVMLDNDNIPTYTDTSINNIKSISVVDLIGRPNLDFNYSVTINSYYHDVYTVDGIDYRLEGQDVTDIVTSVVDNVITINQLSLVAMLSEYHDADVVVDELAYKDLYVMTITNTKDDTSMTFTFGIYIPVDNVELDKPNIEYPIDEFITGATDE